MELRHLRYFVAVAEDLNFTKASQRLHIAQPPLSRQIRQLEDELGIQLFIRDRKRVTLTDAGQAFLKEAKSLIAQTARVLDSARRMQNGEAGIVRIGIAAGLGELVNRVIAQHSKRFPGVELQGKDIFSTLQNEALRDRKIDVGFLRPPIDPVNVMSEELLKERFVVLVSKSNPLSKHKTLHLKQLINEPLLLHERNVSSGVYDRVLGLYHRAGITPNVVHTATGPYEEAGAILVASGKGIYLGVGEVVAHPACGSQVAVVPLDEPGAAMAVHVAWRKEERSPAVLSFLDSVRREVKTGQNGIHLSLHDRT